MQYATIIRKQARGLVIPTLLVAASTVGLWFAAITVVSGQTLPPPAPVPGEPLAPPPAPPVPLPAPYDGGGASAITANERYVFVLRGGVLLQYDVRSLRLVNQATLTPSSDPGNPVPGGGPQP
jgi:hypothetical protein